MQYVSGKNLIKLLVLTVVAFVMIQSARAEEVVSVSGKGVCYCSNQKFSIEQDVQNNQECFALQKEGASCTLHVDGGKTFRFGEDAETMIEIQEQTIDFDSLS